MILGWILLALAVTLAVALSVMFVHGIIVASRLAPKRPRPQLPWELRRLNPVVPKANRNPGLARPGRPVPAH